MATHRRPTRHGRITGALRAGASWSAPIRDALDFVGWYNHRSAKSLGLDKADAYSLYLAYYVGPTGYKRGVWKNEPRIQGYARRVADRAYRYRVQLQRCEEKLKHRGFLWF
jgi:hypothetical protein